MKLKISLILILQVLFFSCMVPPKDIVYFQDLDKYQQNIRIAGDSMVYEPIIKKYDELMITVAAPVLDQEIVAQFNLPAAVFLVPGETNIQQPAALQTYIVGHDGTINFPVIGRIPLAGLTKSQAIEQIRQSVSNHIKDPVINMKIISFNVTVLGEVLKPGTIPVTQERVSVLDAIGAVGDLTIYGDRKNVLLIRENNAGDLDHIRLDLTSSELFTSPYYYLQQNDKIIVEPNSTKQMESKYSPANSYKLSIYSMIFSALSVITSTTITIISLRKN